MRGRPVVAMDDSRRAQYAELRARSRAVCEQARRLRAEARALMRNPPRSDPSRLEQMMAEVERIYGRRSN